MLIITICFFSKKRMHLQPRYDMVYFCKILNRFFVQKLTINMHYFFCCACFYSVCTALQCVYFGLKKHELMSFKKRDLQKNQKVFEMIQLARKTNVYSYCEKLLSRKSRADVNIVKVESN